MDKILTLEEVAELLRVSERTVVEWVSKGEIPGGKIGTSWRFQESELKSWLDSKLSPRVKSPDDAYNSIKPLIDPSRVKIIDKESKVEVLNSLIDSLIGLPGLKSSAALSKAIFAREELMSTGVGLNTAFPHCRLNTIDSIYVSIGVTKKPLTDYESLDGKPVQIVIMIIAGRNKHTEYISILSLFSKYLKDETLRKQIYNAESDKELYSILTRLGETV